MKANLAVPVDVWAHEWQVFRLHIFVFRFRIVGYRWPANYKFVFAWI